MIRIDGLSHRYANGKLALNSIDLQIDKGEFVVIAGKNGSGKSTLVRHMNALLLPSEGSVLVNGMLSSEKKNRWLIRQAVSMVFQNPDSQFVGMTVEEDVAFGPENLCMSHEDIRSVVDSSLRSVGISEYKKHSPLHLSGGQKQKAAIASALAMNPEYIIFDEVTSMLDPVSRKDILDVIEHIHGEGTTVIHVTHRLEEAIKADRLIIMDAGKVVLDGTPSEILASDELANFGLELPPMLVLAKKLHDAGILTGGFVFLKDELLEELCLSISKI
ncbi:energy-coupling factor transporter ATPase [Methanolobus sp. ZRKC3]|uniref:energy-coupling factor transporter ATPase n=1 Tax=Methanolobus sp. ZRKC3 TaxID=3125786 RepID=UPI003243B258